MKGRKLRHRLSALLLCTAFISSCFSNAFSAVAEDVGDEDTSPIPEGCVASITTDTGTDYYQTLAEAIQAVEDGKTIDLLDDITGTITSNNKSYTLEMHDHSISGEGVKRVYEINGGTVTLQNGILENGYVSGYGNNGAGLYGNKANVNLYDMVIRENKNNYSMGSNGAGVAVVNGDLKIEGSALYDNTAVGDGGAIYYSNNGAASILSVKDSTIHNNFGKNSSGIYVWSAQNVYLEHVTFEKNTGTAPSTAALFYAGTSIGGDFTVTDCDFIENKSEGTSYGNSIIATQGKAPVFKNCNFTDNFGAYYTLYCKTVTFENCLIANNTATMVGGIRANGGEITLINSVIRDNTATGTGTVSGGIVTTNNQEKINLVSGAVYNNISENTEENDLYINQYSTVNMIAPNEMKDTFTEGVDFSKYRWLKDDSDYIEGAIDGKVSDLYSQDLLLTAFEYIERDVAEYDGTGYRTIRWQ